MPKMDQSKNLNCEKYHIIFVIFVTFRLFLSCQDFCQISQALEMWNRRGPPLAGGS